MKLLCHHCFSFSDCEPEEALVCKNASCGERIFVQTFCSTCLRVYVREQESCSPCAHGACTGNVEHFPLDLTLLACMFTLLAVGVNVPWTPCHGVAQGHDLDSLAEMALSRFRPLLIEALAAQPAYFAKVPDWAARPQMLRAVLAKNPEAQPFLTVSQCTAML